MKKNPKSIKTSLIRTLEDVAKSKAEYCLRPEQDFLRKRKLNFLDVLKIIIGFNAGNLSNELIDASKDKCNIPTTSAFVQARSKIDPRVFKDILTKFTEKHIDDKTQDMTVLAIDGSDVRYHANPDDTLCYFPGTNGQKHYNLVHVNALYDINNEIYRDVLIQHRREANEHLALLKLVDISTIKKALLIADRGYESYNDMAHIQKKGWYYLIRIKDGKQGIKAGYDLPETDEFDIEIKVNFTRKQTNEVKRLIKENRNSYKYIPHTDNFDFLPLNSKKSDATIFYELNFRMVRFKISDNEYETVVTNLDKNEYTPDKLKELYASRWGIETSFRSLKYTVGMLNFHTKKLMCVKQEIYANMIMYNFTKLITKAVPIAANKNRKHKYKHDFTVAVHMCRLLFKGLSTPKNVETTIARNVMPVRADRHYKRININPQMRYLNNRVA